MVVETYNLRWVWLVLACRGVVGLSSSASVRPQAVLARLMQGDVTAARTQELLDALPAVEEEAHGYQGARRPLLVPLGERAALHVLPAGARLGRGEEAVSRVLSGRVRLRRRDAGAGQFDDGARCVCFGGETCPRTNCRFRIEPVDFSESVGGIAMDGESKAFDAAQFDIVAESTSLVLDAYGGVSSFSGPRRAPGAMLVAKCGPAAAAQSLWVRDTEKRFEPLVRPEPLTSDEENDDVETLEAPTLARLDDGEALGVAGLDDLLAELDTRLRMPLAAPPDLLKELGVAPVRGVLFYGAPGCGKTLAATKIAEALDASGDPVVVAAPQLLDRYLGQSEANIRRAFFGHDDEEDTRESGSAAAVDDVVDDDPSWPRVRCVVVDEIDAIAASRSTDGAPSGADRARDSIVNQLLSIMDGTGQRATNDTFVVLATTNRLDLIDDALLRPGRFEIQCEVQPPTPAGRSKILHLHTKTARQYGRLTDRAHAALDRLALSAFPDGTTGASIAAVVRLAASFALERYFSDRDHLPTSLSSSDAVQIDLPDLERATARVLGSNGGGENDPPPSSSSE